MRRATGRAELVRLLAALPPGSLARAARLLGFAATAPDDEPPPLPQVTGPALAAAPPAPRLEPAEAAPVPFWLPQAMSFTRDSELPRPVALPEATGGLTRDDLRSGRGLSNTPRQPPLSPWPRLWPVLRAALHSRVPGQRPDLGALVQALGRGQVLRRIPRLIYEGWAPRAAIWVDRSARLTPFWADQAEVCRRLRRLCGRSGLVVRVLDERALALLPEEGRALAAGLRVDPAAPILVLGDLGMYGPPALRERWRRTAGHLRRAGARIRALVPMPPGRWERPTARAWSAVPWERGRPGIPPSREEQGAPRQAEHADGAVEEDGAPARREVPPPLERRAARLLRLLAPTALVQPGLLRALRRLLPAGQADAGTEADVWAHPDVAAADATGLLLGAAAAARRRAEFAREPAALQGAAVRTIRRWHQGLPRELHRAEVLALHACAPGQVPAEDLADARAFADRLAETLRTGGGDAAVAAALARYGRASLAGLPDAIYQQVPALAWVWARAFQDVPGAVVPATLDPRALRAALDPAGPDRDFAVHLDGGLLRVSPAAEGARAVAGSLVGWIAAARPYLDVKIGEGARAQHPLSAPVAIPLVPGEDVELRTDRCALSLQRWLRPAWATAAGRDRYGLWAEARVAEVPFRLRWIPPGRFLMGSPEGEQGRYKDEGPQHEVELSRGYWLGETPVTQALWTAVMGRNPSRFVSAERPVEQVSWDDCQAFLRALDQRIPGLAPRLPTEAEWERACRGGTTAATWLGELKIAGAHDAPLLDSIAWYGGNSGVAFELADGYDSKNWPEKQYDHERAGTHPVGRKAANPLGLYDMLGNALEWCHDWGGPYGNETSRDPVGPPTGSRRVVRGGAWRLHARVARAAYRLGFVPGDRFGILGFRLAGGQGTLLPASQQAEPRSGSAARGAGRDPSRAAPRDAAPPTPGRRSTKKGPPR